MRTLLSAVVLALVAAVCLGTFTEDAHAQFFGVRYSEKVSTTLKTAIGSTQPPPFGIKVASGDGSKFANVGTYFILTLDAANSTNATAIEEILVRYISGDSLLVLARGTNVALNRPQQAWVLNSYLGIRVSYVVIAQIQDTLIKRMAMLDSVAHLADSTRALLPSQSGKSGKVLSTNGTNLFWTAAAGAVSSVIATTPLTGGTITSTGAIGIAIADATHTGAISNTDWNTLMAKQDALPSLIASRVLSNNGSALFWSTAGAGTVTSVSGTGGTTGLTVTNVPITTTGTFTLGGTLVVANGGTGAGTRAQGLLNLLPDISGHIGEYLRILPLDSSIVWDTASGGGGGTGTVTSIDVSGGITGLTTSGGPVTTSGTITLAGTLSDTNGGTQQSSWTKGDLLYASAANALSKLAIGTTNKVLTVISGLPSWQTPTTGTVTSTALAMPAEFSVSGSPTTTAGTFTVTKVSQAQNLVYAAPDTGAGLPYFRTLVAADIPAISAADITSGTLAVARGGTNTGSYSTGDLLYASSSSVLAKLAVGGAHGVVHGGSVPSYSAVDLASDITGTLQIANGGTNSSTALSGSSIMISNGTSVVQGAAGTSTTLLHGNAGGAPTYSAVATADITDSNVTAVKIATSAVSLTKQVSGLLPVTNGGTALGTLTNHAIQVGAGTSSPTQLGLGTSTTVLHGAAAGDPTWGAVSLTTDITGTLSPSNGGSGLTSITSNRLLLGRGNNSIVTLADDSLGAQLASNKVLLSNGASNDPFFGISTLGASFAVNLDTMANRTGGTTGTLTKRLGIQPGTLSPTAPLFACVQKNSTSTASVWYQVLIDSSTRSTGLNAIAHKAPNNMSSSFNTNEGISVGYVFGLASSNGIVYANQAEVESPGAQGSYDTVITDARLTASSVLIVSCEKSAASLSGRWYVPYIKARAAGSWTYRLTQDITNNDQAMAALEGCRVDYGTFVTTPDRKVVAGRDSAVCTAAGQNGFLDTITCAEANANSIVLTTLESNAQTPTTTDISFYATPEPPANWPAGKFIVEVHQAHGSGVRINAGNSLTVNWVVINATNTNAQPNWTFAGAPVAITNTSNQIILGGSTTSTLNIPTGTSDTITFPSATGTLATTGATGGGTAQTSYTTGDMLYASATNTLSKKAIGSTNDILTVAAGIPSWTSTPTLSALNVTNGTTLLGAFNLHVQTTKTTTYTILSSDCVVPCDATSAAFTATLPAGATVGQVVIVSKIDGSVNAVTVAPGVAQTIIAATGVLSSGNVSLTTTNPNAHLCYIGSNNWILISRD